MSSFNFSFKHKEHRKELGYIRVAERVGIVSWAKIITEVTDSKQYSAVESMRLREKVLLDGQPQAANRRSGVC